jgi:hypothetical protein
MNSAHRFIAHHLIAHQTPKGVLVVCNNKAMVTHWCTYWCAIGVQ